MSVSSITSKAPDLGNIVAAPGGDTVFTVDPSGSINQTSGTGIRLTGGTSQVTVTIKCGGQAACDTADANISISNVGSPTGRARALTSFAVSGVTALTGSLTGNPVTFSIAPIGKSSSATFHLGMDFALAGEGSGLSSGTSVSNFIVEIGPIAGALTASRTSTGGTAKVFRPIAISKVSDLSFGAIVLPKTGGAYVTINKTSGARGTGGAIGLPSPAFGYAEFMITGEGSQQFTVATDDSLTMTNASGDMLVAQLLPSASGSKRMSGSLGNGGALDLTVGAGMNISNTTPSGAYVGTFMVTVSYN
jgi:hypothetical protein